MLSHKKGCMLLSVDNFSLQRVIKCGNMCIELDMKLQSTQPSSLTSSGISLVTSILNDQQSRPSGMTTNTIRLPSPPLIEPRLSALSR